VCESNAHFSDGDHDTLIMESVDVLEPDGEADWRLVDLFGDQKTVKYRIKQMNLVDHRILFEE